MSDENAVTEYVATLDDAHRAAVARVYDRARSVAGEVTEGRSYGMPALRYRGSPLVSVQVTKQHVGLYPFSPPVIAALADELAGFRVTKGSISFQPEAPLPDGLVDRLVAARRDEIDAMKARRPGKGPVAKRTEGG